MAGFFLKAVQDKRAPSTSTGGKAQVSFPPSLNCRCLLQQEKPSPVLLGGGGLSQLRTVPDFKSHHSHALSPSLGDSVLDRPLQGTKISQIKPRWMRSGTPAPPPVGSFRARVQRRPVCTSAYESHGGHRGVLLRFGKRRSGGVE